MLRLIQDWPTWTLFSGSSKNPRHFSALVRFLFAASMPSLVAGAAQPRFLGPPTCATSLCHGGAGELRHQVHTWEKLDIHSRTYHTLVNARSAQIAAVLKIPDATRDARCTTCHAPFQQVPAAALANFIDPKQGVSCESCHGPAESWLRSHTRPDFAHRDRVLAGLRDLRHPYVRANSCVACHQNLEPDLLAAGHPELLFELDGQAVSQPKHWREQPNWHGPQAWFVGQAVALREASWQLLGMKTPRESFAARWDALLWLLRQSGEVSSALPKLPATADAADKTAVATVQQTADALARQAAELEWTPRETRACLQRLLRTHSDFADATVAQPQQARRAERLVLALDRLVIALPSAEATRAEPHLKQLFALAQSLPDFAPAKFAAVLEAWARQP